MRQASHPRGVAAIPGRSSTLGVALAAAAASTAMLRDVFRSVNNRVNGYEHYLRRQAKHVRWWRRSSNAVNHFEHRSGCGPQESARRRRQIERGILTISNGLHCPGVKYLGHGRVLRETN